MSILAVEDEVEIVGPVELTGEQEVIVELHSVINLINALYGCLDLLDIEFLGNLGVAKSLVMDLAQKIRETSIQRKPFEVDSLFSGVIGAAVESAWALCPEVHENPDALTLKKTVQMVLEVFHVRLEELEHRLKNPDGWMRVSAEELVKSITQALAAIEKNSRGRYRIVFNIAEQSPKDYQVDLKIASEVGDSFLMPAVLQDVMRDLIANARKYTLAGGKISAGLWVTDEMLRFVVEDNGIGIPAEELSKVVKFGYRAANTQSMQTLGGGFGMTKAYWVTKKYQGRMWIRSRVGVGTRVTIEIPRLGEA